MRSDIAAVGFVLCGIPVLCVGFKCMQGFEWTSSLLNRPVAMVRKFQDNIDILTKQSEHLGQKGWENLGDKEAERRLELGQEGVGCTRGNISVLEWVERVEKIKNQLSDAKRLVEQINNCSSYFISRRKLARRVDNLSREVEILRDATPFFWPSEIEKNVTMPTLPFSVELIPEIWNSFIDPMIGTIGIYGLGGVGKTTTMLEIRDQLERTELFDKIIWVTMSKNMMLEKVQDDIAMQLSIVLPASEDLSIRASRLVENLNKVKKCVFLLDNMWAPVKLEEVGIPEPKFYNGVKIVLTTRFPNVCMLMRADRRIHLAPLPENEAWDLFVTKTGNQVLDPEIEIIAKEIVDECGGLPIVINTIGHAMKDKINVTAWTKALKDLRSTQPEILGGMKHTPEHVFNLLRCFGYSRLQKDEVRKCFLYCAVFPGDYKFESKELIGYWMAEGFILKEGDIVTSINEGLEILKVLKDANVLEMLMQGGNEWFKMHDLFRDLAIRIMGEDPGFLVKSSLGLTDCPKDSELKGAKIFSLIRNRIQNFWYTPSYDPIYSSVSTLLLKDNPLRHIHPHSFSCFPNLQFLDMSYTGILYLTDSLCELAKLRVLFLHYCTSLKRIPYLGKLKELQVLNLRGTLIEKMPQGIEELVSLRSLDLSETLRLEYIQIGVISSLSNLQELHMQGSNVCKMESQTEANCFNDIRCLKQLAILTLSAVGFEDHLDMIVYLQGQNLKTFSINVYGSTSDYIEDVEEFEVDTITRKTQSVTGFEWNFD